jgi:pimeloyl-ACP methyl ester carboxylesterase
LDWSDPSGARISLAVSRLRANPAARQGVMLTNPGGPGGSGLALPAYLQPAVPDTVGEAYDWIGFDPRGVGASSPAVSCDTEYWTGPRPAYRPASREQRSPAERAWVKRSRSYAAACAEHNGDLLRHLRTADTVRDMNALRIALGEKQINYYGFSYGTYLGQAYASRYPGRVRRMVLDGNVPPNYAGYGDGGRAQAIAFERVMSEFFDWVAAHDTVYGLGVTGRQVRLAYNDELAKLTRRPVRGIGAAEWTNVIQLAGFAESEWPEVADAFADWRSGKYYSTRGLYEYAGEVGDDNSYAAFLATVCTDAAFPRTYRTIRSDAFSIAKQAPFEAWTNLWFAAPCTWWPAPAGNPLRIDGSRLHTPILLIQATGDGLAPYAGAVALRREFPTARLIAEQGATTHAGSLSGNVCIDDAIAVYLADGTLPERRAGDGPDSSCPRLPVPEPSAKDRSIVADTTR